MSYAKKTMFSTIWNVGLNIYNQAATFVVYALLARILLVEDFGLIAFCFLLTEMTVLFGNFGVNQILIQRPRWSQNLASNCFWFLLVAGGLLGAVLGFVAGPISNQFFYEGSWSMLAVLGLIPILNSISLVSYARMMRNFQYKQIATLNMIATTIGAVISIWGVLAGFGVWAVVWGRVIQTITLTVCVVSFDKFIPNFTFSAKIFRVILKFGLPLFYQTAVHFLSDRSLAIAVAASLGATQFAYIALAQRAFRMIREVTITPLNGILLSAFSRLGDKTRIEGQYVRVVKLASTIIIPLFIGAASVSEELIEIAFGDKWQISATLFTMLCFTIIFNSLAWYIPQVLVSIKRTDLSFRLHLLTALFNLAFCIIGAQHSPTAAVIGLLLSSIILFPIKFILIRRYLKLRLNQVLIAAIPAMICSLIMFSTVKWVSINYAFESMPIAIVTKIAIGATTYIGAHIILFRTSLKLAFLEIRGLVRK